MRRLNFTATEDLVIYIALIVTGTIPMAVAVARHVFFDASATVGLLMILVGIAGVTYLASRWQQARRL
jgi:hypothetical protein